MASLLVYDGIPILHSRVGEKPQRLAQGPIKTKTIAVLLFDFSWSPDGPTRLRTCVLTILEHLNAIDKDISNTN